MSRLARAVLMVTLGVLALVAILWGLKFIDQEPPDDCIGCPVIHRN